MSSVCRIRIMPRRYEVCAVRCCCRVLFSTLHKHGQDDSNTQMAINNWCGYVFGGQSILSMVILIRFYLKSQEQQETNPALDMESRSRTPQDILNDYKKNQGSNYLTRSERRFRERQLSNHLGHFWSLQQSRSCTSIQGLEPVNVDPALKKISRTNRQLMQPCLEKSHIAHLHLSFDKLCIYTALPFLTLILLCHYLRISLTELYVLEIEEGSDEVELYELDPVRLILSTHQPANYLP